ncbi:unnamed protein product [Brugia pahangi]|uniref:Ovule protein n=1 Tax=Brugia pahangi TaxID=6280 RepID=A0A0N4TDQ9_BRUPA|nr:unnamed protein product [Brugia pahangi]
MHCWKMKKEIRGVYFHRLKVSANISAWSILAQFISNQIRFGYEMELMLRVELKKLNIDGQMKQK